MRHKIFNLSFKYNCRKDLIRGKIFGYPDVLFKSYHALFYFHIKYIDFLYCRNEPTCDFSIG